MRCGRRAVALAWALTLILILQVGIPATWDTPLAPGTAHAAIEQKFATDLGASCASTDEGEVWCWGPAFDGSLGDGRQDVNWNVMPTPIPVPAQISGVAAGAGPCAVTTADQVYCWGAAGITEDGTGSLFSRPPWSSSIPRTYGFAPSSKVAGRCALNLSGAVQCVGWNHWGQLGNGGPGWPAMGWPTTPPSSGSAVTVVGLTGVVDISAATGGTYCAVKGDGSVWCWGINDTGGVGDGQSGNTEYACPPGADPGAVCQDVRYQSSPSQVVGITDAVSVHQSCAIRTGGAVSCWGQNTGGRYTSAPESAVFTATEIAEFEGAVDLDVDRRSTCVVYEDGTARCRGAGYLGGGVNSTPYGSADLPLDEVREIETVNFATRCARRADGTVACWGSNFSGEVGVGTYGNGAREVLTPQYVIGFGGEIPEPELSVDVEFVPAEVLIELDDAGEPIPTDLVAKVTITNDSQTETVENVRLDNVLDRYLDRGPVQGLRQATFPDQSSLEWASIAPGASVTAEIPLMADSYGDFGVGATVWWDAPESGDRVSVTGRGRITVELDDGFEVAVTGEATNDPSVVRVIAKIRNTADEFLDGIVWAGDDMALEILEGAEPLTLGPPSAPLPDSLHPLETITVTWNVDVADIGIGVFGLHGTATTSLGTPAEAFEEMSAQVTAGLIRSIDLYKEVTAGVENQLATGAAEGDALVEQSITDVANETEQFRQQEYDSWIGLGFDDRTARFLASGAVNRQAVSNYFAGLGTGAEEAIDRLGAQDGESLWKIYDTITDPVKRRAFAEGLVKMARDEYGYLESGFNNPGNLGAVDLQVAYDSWSGVATETRDSIGYAAVGQADIWRIEAGEFAADPLAFGSKVGQRHGGQGATVGYYTAVGVVEEVATGGLGPVTRAGNLVEGGVDSLRNTSRGAEAVDAGTDALGSATRRMAEGEAAAKRFQDLPYGSTVDLADLERLGGFSSTDAARIDGIIAEVKTKYGVDVEMVFRTAEPMSVGIDGVGKRAFTKEKAVGQLDLMLGAPDALAGKVTIFKPEPLPRAILEEIEWDNPGFTARYQERLQTQQKNWAAFEAGSARTQKIAAASEKYGGVDVLDGVPGRPTYGVEYMQQLTDPEYLATRPDLTPAQIQELQNYPATTYTNLRIDRVDGAYTVSDLVKVRQPDGSFVDVKKPVISDYDGQAVHPVGGEWPAGKRGEIEAYIKREMDEIGRSGRHGWSDAANDLPAEYFDLAAEYVMSTTHPAVARRVAEDLQRRFQLLADEFTKKADRLEATIGDVPAGPLRDKRQAQIDKLRATAATYRTLTADQILKKWPPGEKTIVFTAGRISVGSNQGTP